MHDPSVDLSLVIPLLNEQEVFDDLLARLEGLVERLTAHAPRDRDAASLPAQVEVIFIDDGSTDRTPSLIRAACTRLPWCRGVILSRNFGHQIALSAGMQHARGQAVALLDGDLQDPPEVIQEFFGKLREGYDVVYAVRRQRKEGLFKRAAYAGFYRLMQKLATIPIPLDSGDFCIMTRRVVQTINAMPERHRFIRGMRSWVGFQQVGHTYPRAARAKGESKYSMAKLMRLALDGIFTFSEKPLQWVTMMGLTVAAGSLVYGLYVVLWRIFGNPPEQLKGWATLAVGMLFLGGVQLISIGILGEYIGRIHNEVKARPLYVVDERYGFDTDSAVQEPAARAGEGRGGGGRDEGARS